MRFQFRAILLVAIILTLTAPHAVLAAGAAKTPNYTEAEKEWLRTAPEIRVTITLGTAPLQFFDEKDKPAGVAVGCLDRISQISGLKFVYNKGGSLKILEKKARSGATDIISCLPEQHAGRFKQYPMSDIFLRSRTVLVVNNDVSAENLTKKRYAAIRDSALPKGVNAEHAIYYPSRLNCIKAVNDGEADYCFSNEFSIAYYTVRKNFKNITTIPLESEPREYRFVYINSGDIFTSVMKKTMAAIPPTEMQSVILESMSKISPEINMTTIFDIYGVEILSTGFVLLLILIVVFGQRLLRRSNHEKEVFEERAKHDSLTGLYNFAACRDLISKRLESVDPESTGAFLMMDIDKFKTINDTMGHYEGDQVLMAMADALTSTFRKSDIKGRLGGDEFCVFMDYVTEEVVENSCERLRSLIFKMAEDRDKPRVTISIGIAMTKKGRTFDELYKISDGALYDVKRSGGDNCGFARQ